LRVAHVAWTATYARKDQPGVAIDFDVHYFVRKLDGEPKVFGWVSGDEQALLKKHGDRLKSAFPPFQDVRQAVATREFKLTRPAGW
jgi:hypothetical protein